MDDSPDDPVISNAWDSSDARSFGGRGGEPGRKKARFRFFRPFSPGCRGLLLVLILLVAVLGGKRSPLNLGALEYEHAPGNSAHPLLR